MLLLYTNCNISWFDDPVWQFLEGRKNRVIVDTYGNICSHENMMIGLILRQLCVGRNNETNKRTKILILNCMDFFTNSGCCFYTTSIVP